MESRNRPGLPSVAMGTPVGTQAPPESSSAPMGGKGEEAPGGGTEEWEGRGLFLRGRWWEVSGFMRTPGGTNGETTKAPGDTGMPGGAAAGPGTPGGGIERPGVPGGEWEVPEDCRALPGSAGGFQGDSDGYRPGRCPGVSRG